MEQCSNLCGMAGRVDNPYRDNVPRQSLLTRISKAVVVVLGLMASTKVLNRTDVLEGHRFLRRGHINHRDSQAAELTIPESQLPSVAVLSALSQSKNKLQTAHQERLSVESNSTTFNKLAVPVDVNGEISSPDAALSQLLEKSILAKESLNNLEKPLSQIEIQECRNIISEYENFGESVVKHDQEGLSFEIKDKQGLLFLIVDKSILRLSGESYETIEFNEKELKLKVKRPDWFKVDEYSLADLIKKAKNLKNLLEDEASDLSKIDKKVPNGFTNFITFDLEGCSLKDFGRARLNPSNGKLKFLHMARGYVDLPDSARKFLYERSGFEVTNKTEIEALSQLPVASMTLAGNFIFEFFVLNLVDLKKGELVNERKIWRSEALVGFEGFQKRKEGWGYKGTKSHTEPLIPADLNLNKLLKSN